VNGKENVEHHVCRNYSLIEVDAGDFGMARSAITNSLVAGVVDVATHVANLNIDDSLELHVAAVETPEATAT
jgi:hypothetical protein